MKSLRNPLMLSLLAAGSLCLHPLLAAAEPDQAPPVAPRRGGVGVIEYLTCIQDTWAGDESLREAADDCFAAPRGTAPRSSRHAGDNRATPPKPGSLGGPQR